MKKVFLMGLAIFLKVFLAAGQTGVIYSLQNCIDTALANNIEVKQNGLLAEEASVNVKQAQAYAYPELFLGLDHGINQGRSIDPYSNSYVNQSVNYAGYGVGSGITLFNGFNLQNTIRQNKAAYQASAMEWQQAKDNLTLNVILGYLQVLSNEDLLASANRQKALSTKQLERLQVLDSAGAISPSLVTDLTGQLINDELTVLNLKNQLETSKLNLAQLMYIPYNSSMSLERINTDEFLSDYSTTAAEIYQTTLQEFALVKALKLRKESSMYALKAARGAMFPIVSLSGNAQTNYSSAAQNSFGKIHYGQQVENNVFTTVNLGLRIPVFNYLRAKNNIRLASIEVRRNELTELNTKRLLQQQIDRAYLNMTISFESFKTLRQQVDAYAISFKAAETRFAAGVGSSVDYLVAKNNFDRSNINLIASKYDFVLRKKVLDYYQNIRK